jgi:hypothetical protein
MEFTERTIHSLDRCHLKGQTGDRLHAVLRSRRQHPLAAGMIAKKGLLALLALLLRLLRLAKAGAISLRPCMMHSQLALG